MPTTASVSGDFLVEAIIGIHPKQPVTDV